MSEIVYQIPPVTIHNRISNISEAQKEYLGWQLRGWMIELIHSEFDIKGANILHGVGDTGVSAEHLKEGGDLECVVDAKSFINGEKYFDRNGHGSHCQSNIAACENGKGVLGYAPMSEGYHAKVLSDRGSGGDYGIAKGIDWLANKGCRVISLSLGSPSRSQSIVDAINEANRDGIIVICASGNDGQRNGVDYPAAGANCLIGCAIDSNLRLAGFSDRGPQVAQRGVSGAGVRVYGCNSKGYTMMSGTSMATPSVAGQLVLALDAEVEFLGRQVTKGYKGALDLITNYKLDLGEKGNDSGFGIGAFDVYSYVKHLYETQTLLPDDEVPPPPEKNQWKTISTFDNYRVQKKD